MKRWEYHAEIVRPEVYILEEVMNGIGDGWEAFQIERGQLQTVIYCRREIEPEPHEER